MEGWTVGVIEHRTELAASAEAVWRHATSMDGINAELAPIRMSAPADLGDLGATAPPLGTPLFTSTVRLGPVPFDRHRLTLVAWDPGAGFVEESTSLLHRRWRHERRVTPAAGGCVVTDRVEVEPRLPGARALTERVVERVFTRRHARLAARFGVR